MNDTLLLVIKLAVTTSAVVAWYWFKAYKTRNRLLVFTGLLVAVSVLVLAGCTSAPSVASASSCPPAPTTPTVPPEPILDGSYRDGAAFPC